MKHSGWTMWVALLVACGDSSSDSMAATKDAGTDKHADACPSGLLDGSYTLKAQRPKKFWSSFWRLRVKFL